MRQLILYDSVSPAKKQKTNLLLGIKKERKVSWRFEDCNVSVEGQKGVRSKKKKKYVEMYLSKWTEFQWVLNNVQIFQNNS